MNLPKLKFLRCGHSWIPRSPVLPKNCPKWITSYWNMQECGEMGRIGGKTIEFISTNPYYKDMADTIKLPILKGLRCGYEWVPRTMYPKYCPICNSPYRNKPK
jgi:hypothetical protein